MFLTLMVAIPVKTEIVLKYTNDTFVLTILLNITKGNSENYVNFKYFYSWFIKENILLSLKPLKQSTEILVNKKDDI